MDIPPGAVFVVLTFLGCGTAIAFKALDAIFGKHRQDRSDASLREFRQQIAELKSWASELVLSFETTLEQHEARLKSLESRALGEGTGATASLGPGSVAAREAPEPEPLKIRTGV
jgi:hypothetical protein